MKVKFDDIKEIYEKEVRANTKNKKKIYRFERYKMQYLTEIVDVLEQNQYKKMHYNVFLIRSPKYRIAMSLNISDKIINHYLTRHILMKKLEHYLDCRNVATRKGLGRDAGIKLVLKYLEHFKKFPKAYVLKMDISKYFYKIDHQVLKNMLKKDLTEEEYQVISMIIDSTNQETINLKINQIKKEELSKVKVRKEELQAIPFYEKGKGLPIGNMSSQFLSIYYLHEMDHKIVHDYRLKYFVRYMDDILIFSENKEYLQKILKKLEQLLNENYLLELNSKKTMIIPLKEGFNFCGYHFKLKGRKTIVTVSADTKRRVKKRIQEVHHDYFSKRYSFASTFSSIMTYDNGFCYGNIKKIKRVLETYFFYKEKQC